MLLIDTYLDIAGEKGIGLFAKNKIPKGDIWWVRNAEFDQSFAKGEFENLPEITRKFIREYGFLEATGVWYLCIDNARFTNHSDDPNADNNWNDKGELVSCFALREIEAGEEILCNYKDLCITCTEGLTFENKE